MKRILYSVLSLVLMGLITSCGSSKKALDGSKGLSDDGEAIARDICIEMQEQAPATRAWGNGQHFNINTATNIAELQARSKFARAIATSIKTSTKVGGLDVSKFAGDDKSGMSVSDEATKMTDWAEAIAYEVVRNAVIIKSSPYKKADKYNVYVCLEYKEGLDDLVNNVAKKVQEKISTDNKLKIDLEFSGIKDELKKDIIEYGKKR